MIPPALRQQLHRRATESLARSLIIALSLVVSACCTPGVKPEDANLFQAMCGLGSGDFEDQLESDQNQVALSRQELETEKAKSDTLSTTLEASKTELASLLKEIDQMQKENRRLETQISAMQTETAAAREEQARLQARLQTVEVQLAALKTRAAEEQHALEQYNAEKARLQREIELLRSIISSQ